MPGPSPEPTLWDRLGGEPGARRLITAFVDRVFADPIIGFRFIGVPREALIEREIEHLSGILGGDLVYAGRPLPAVHRPHRINRGQFRRRMALVRTVGAELGIDPAVIAEWNRRDAALERVITTGEDCVPDGS
jgi:hemoglobin